jgi:hypothetical protein
MWTAGRWLLHHNNAPAHKPLSIRQFLTKQSIPTFSKAPPTPALSPPDFFLVPKLKIILKEGRRFQTLEDLITNVTNDLKAIIFNKL